MTIIINDTLQDTHVSTCSDIQRLNRLIKQHYTEKSSKLYKVFPFVLSHVHYNDIPSCALLNSSYHLLVNEKIWSNPNFEKIAYTHDALYVFNKFLSQLPTIQTSTAFLILKLYLQPIQESLYDRVNPEFLQRIVQYCTNLDTLHLERVEFLNARSLPKGKWTLQHLTRLNLSYCPHVNDDMIVQIARSCRQLVQVELDGLVGHKGKGLASLAAECDQLSSVSMRYNTAMKDEAIIALAKFRHIRLLKLDLTGCSKLTLTGFSMLARYAAHVTNLSVAQTNCKLEELKKFSCIERFTESLDISGLCQIDDKVLANWIWQTNCHKLRNLTMEVTTATALVQLSQQLPDNIISGGQVTELKLMHLPEHTPISFLFALTNVFPCLTRVTFVRAYFETDFMHGMYCTPSPQDEIYITDAQLDKFNQSQRQITAIVIREREDDVSCSLFNW